MPGVNAQTAFLKVLFSLPRSSMELLCQNITLE